MYVPGPIDRRVKFHARTWNLLYAFFMLSGLMLLSLAKSSSACLFLGRTRFVHVPLTLLVGRGDGEGKER